MNQTFDLKGMGFAEMQNEELEVVDGGNAFWVLWAAACAITAAYDAGAAFGDGLARGLWGPQNN